jgi:hypothetical protein
MRGGPRRRRRPVQASPGKGAADDGGGYGGWGSLQREVGRACDALLFLAPLRKGVPMTTTATGDPCCARRATAATPSFSWPRLRTEVSTTTAATGVWGPCCARRATPTAPSSWPHPGRGSLTTTAARRRAAPVTSSSSARPERGWWPVAPGATRPTFSLLPGGGEET